MCMRVRIIQEREETDDAEGRRDSGGGNSLMSSRGAGLSAQVEG